MKKITAMAALALSAVLTLSACSGDTTVVTLPPQTAVTPESLSATEPVSSDTPTTTPESEPYSDTSPVSSASDVPESKTDESTVSSEITTLPPASETSVVITTTAVTVPSPEITTEETPAALITTSKPQTSVSTSKTAVVTTTVTTRTTEPSLAVILETKASGTLTEKNDLGAVDYSNAKDGYIMCKYTGNAKKIKVQITDPGGVTQTYNLNYGGNYEVFPLTGGNGGYKVIIAENISGKSYAVAVSLEYKVTLSSQTAPFLRPNQYVDYAAGDAAVKKSSALCGGASNALEKVDAVYSWLVDNVDYDVKLAENLGSGYLPDTDKVVNKKIGICLDYAGTAAAMLRSQGVPTKLVTGYVGSDSYHAWISVYVENTGWVYGVIYFDGKSWVRMDPTFAASSDSSSDIMKYIGNGSNYKTKYVY